MGTARDVTVGTIRSHCAPGTVRTKFSQTFLVNFVRFAPVGSTPGSISFVPKVFETSGQKTHWIGDLCNSKNQRLQIEEVNMIGAFQMIESVPIQKSP